MRALMLTAILLLASLPIVPTTSADNPCELEPPALDDASGVQLGHVDPAQGEDRYQIRLNEGDRLTVTVVAPDTSPADRTVPWLAIEGPLCHIHYLWGGPTLVFTAHTSLDYVVSVNATAETDYVLTHSVTAEAGELDPIDDTWLPCGVMPYCDGPLEEELCGPEECRHGPDPA